jgi:hypothetical protein
VAAGFLAAKLFNKGSSASSSSSAPVSTPKKAGETKKAQETSGQQKEEKVTASEPPRTPFMRSLSASPLDEKKLRPQAVIVIDPVSTGANLAHEVRASVCVLERGLLRGRLSVLGPLLV